MRQYRKNDRAVSPVIATILMVAITVVLAGVLYVWISSLSNTTGGTPTTLKVEFTDANDGATDLDDAQAGGWVKVKQTGGDKIIWDEYRVFVNLVGQDETYELDVEALETETTGVNYGNLNFVSTVADADAITLLDEEVEITVFIKADNEPVSIIGADMTIVIEDDA